MNTWHVNWSKLAYRWRNSGDHFIGPRGFVGRVDVLPCFLCLITCLIRHFRFDCYTKDVFMETIGFLWNNEHKQYKSKKFWFLESCFQENRKWNGRNKKMSNFKVLILNSVDDFTRSFKRYDWACSEVIFPCSWIILDKVVVTSDAMPTSPQTKKWPPFFIMLSKICWLFFFSRSWTYS